MPLTTILEPLTHDEERERLHLERKVERAFYEAGLALMELRDRKLYRSTHRTFPEYCQDRFGFGKSHSYRLINAVEIVDNIAKGMDIEVDSVSEVVSKKVPNWGQNEKQNENEFQLILPTTESQVRPLKPLEPQDQQKAWNQAITRAKGVPSAKIVREVVNEIKGQSKSVTIKNSPQSLPKIEYVPIDNPQVGQQVRICSGHPLFPKVLGTITQLPNRSSAVVELDNSQQRELISLKDLEIQRIVDSNGHVTSPHEGINHVPGVGLEWYVRLDEETWNKLNQYAQQVGTATLGSAVARLLESNKS